MESRLILPDLTSKDEEVLRLEVCKQMQEITSMKMCIGETQRLHIHEQNIAFYSAIGLLIIFIITLIGIGYYEWRKIK
ncbi:MAG: hypothetical protein C5B43_00635 [Verrucomicrobia bacterium]|nr:MAG: hypothetical protein C5B43_00635 [Verrucomicrobiota bacterium]